MGGDLVADTLRAQVAAYEAYHAVPAGDRIGRDKARKAALAAAAAAEAAQIEAAAGVLAAGEQLGLF